MLPSNSKSNTIDADMQHDKTIQSMQSGVRAEREINTKVGFHRTVTPIQRETTQNEKLAQILDEALAVVETICNDVKGRKRRNYKNGRHQSN